MFYEIRNINPCYQGLMLRFSCNDPNQRYCLKTMGNRGMNDRDDGNVGNQGGNAGNRVGNVGNVVDVGNGVRMQGISVRIRGIRVGMQEIGWECREG